MKSNFGPRGLEKIIDEFVKGFGLENQIVFEKIKDIWNEIAGDKIAEKCRIIKVDNETLYVETDSSTWRMEITLRKEKIIGEINKSLGQEAIKSIIIK